jgi:hypothetical protein
MPTLTDPEPRCAQIRTRRRIIPSHIQKTHLTPVKHDVHGAVL